MWLAGGWSDAVEERFQGNSPLPGNSRSRQRTPLARNLRASQAFRIPGGAPFLARSLCPSLSFRRAIRRRRARVCSTRHVTLRGGSGWRRSNRTRQYKCRSGEVVDGGEDVGGAVLRGDGGGQLGRA